MRSSSAWIAIALLAAAACATTAKLDMSTTVPSPDPRVGLRAGWFDAATSAWNMRLVSSTPPSEQFINKAAPGDFAFINSDLSIVGPYVIQGNFSGLQVWDISDPKHPRLHRAFVCPGSQTDVSVYRNLLFVSGEALNGRTDCGTQGVSDTVSHDRLRGIRIFDITDIANPRHITDVQTCRGSHPHPLVTAPGDTANVYIYVSGTAPVRSPNELTGCSGAVPEQDPTTALFRIEVIKVPVAHPEQAAIVSSPRIFNDLAAPPTHGETSVEMAERAERLRAARARGAFIITVFGNEQPLNDGFAKTLLDSTVKARGGTGDATGADSAALRAALPELINKLTGGGNNRPRTGPTQCHDIKIGRAHV